MSEELRRKRAEIAQQYKGDPEGYRRAMIEFDRQEQLKIDEWNAQHSKPQPKETEQKPPQDPLSAEEKARLLKFARLINTNPKVRRALMAAARATEKMPE